MKYTKKETELYEALTEIKIIKTNMSNIFRVNVQGYAKQSKKELDIWVRKIVDNLVDLSKVLKKTKIPKKFLIIKNLEEKR